MLGFDFRTSPIMAAFANGAMAHALDFEDTHDATLVHPHAAVVPAALAIAEFAGGVSGRDFLDAVAIGADLSCRLALGLTESVEKRGFYFIPMLSAYGAAAAAARLLKLVRGRDRAESGARLLPGGVQRCAGDVSGVPSAGGARRIQREGRRDGGPAGAPWPESLRPADRGTGRALCEFRARQVRRGAHAERAGAGLRGRQGELQALAVLPGHPCLRRGSACRLRANRRSLPIASSGSTSTVSPFFAVLCEPPEQKRRPKTAIDAKFSIPFTVAVALRHGDVGLRDFSAERLNDPQLHALADKVNHVVEPDWTAAQSTRGVLSVSLADGRSLTREVIDPLGHPLNPMDESAMRRKFEDCLAVARDPMDAAAVQRLTERLEGIEQTPMCGRCLAIRFSNNAVRPAYAGTNGVRTRRFTAPRNNRRSNDRCAVRPNRR